ncbi:bifunctional uroporphyrinogen-III synthetase/response regulator domain protein [compost metagenome]
MLKQVLEAFSGPVLAAAVGKVTAEALFEEGIERVLYPEEERMGSMVVALSRYYSEADEAEAVAEALMNLAEALAPAELAMVEAANASGECSKG